MHKDLQRRLREMGVVRGARELAARPSRRRVAIEDLVEGRFITTSHGRCFIAEETHPLDHLHGDLSLAAFLDLSTEALAQVAQDDALARADLRRVCFLDTETTGLSGGAGTMAFVVGVGFFADAADVFCVHQYFLRDPGDEPAMVEGLVELLSEFEALVSFNGRAFDVPIIENRFILARIPPPTAGLPHLDLLQPARRLWRYRLPSCRLGVIEQEVLGVLREQDDVPSGVIPILYRDYLRTGDAREMQRVLYHNAIDILSLVTLAVRLCQTFASAWGEADSEADAGLSGAEFYGLGRWYAKENRSSGAEQAYHAALARDDLPPHLREKTLCDLAYLLKRANRKGEAFAYWQQLALEETADILAHVELAKYFEWDVENLALAIGWTQAALGSVERWPAGLRRDDTLAELHHRLERLEQKLSQEPCGEG
ncbi:MAG: ribonuclease H-like domain-containing protein [Anaerolineae bacterium]|nr:ribonuclease H-like domain-containing protein [Anaerolineae bacterium]